ncbi:hypothetical protein [Bartonella sp. AP57NXGY]|uniref:hypothetical protein n=2 Tax=unclassified Bartonella TaxID=2645622 RepID=UPI0035CFAB79
MVCVMLSFLGETTWGGLADMEKEGMRNFWGGGMLGGSLLGKMLVVGWLRGRTSGGEESLKRMQGICWRGDMRCGKGGQPYKR